MAMAANCTGKICRCYEAGIYQPDETPPPDGLIVAATVHIYLVVVLGTLCNGVAIWCVASCKKTRAAVKVLLYSVFVPVLLICLVTRTMRGEMMFALRECNPEMTPFTYRMVTSLLYSYLAQVELACIATLAIVRTVAVWSPQRHAISLRVSVAVVISIFIYSIFTGVGILGAVFLGFVESETLKVVLTIVYFFINVMLPFIVTATAYGLMLFVMKRNKQRMAACKSSRTGSVMDQATRAMLAVFISNLVFGFPHAVYHIAETGYTHTFELSFHMLFYTHFVVDPLVFIWYNSNYRQQVWEGIHSAWVFALGCCRTRSPNATVRKISSAFNSWKPSLSTQQTSPDSRDKQGTPSTSEELAEV